jgi:hypothetical protein
MPDGARHATESTRRWHSYLRATDGNNNALICLSVYLLVKDDGLRVVTITASLNVRTDHFPAPISPASAPLHPGSVPERSVACVCYFEFAILASGIAEYL